MIPGVVGVPIKPFGVAKARLAPALDAEHRARLGMAVAAHTLTMLAASGVDPHVVTADAGVAAWAGRHGWEVLREPTPGGLNAAAAEVTRTAGDGSWAVVHADLPTVEATDFAAVWQSLGDHGAIAPSRDGGTALLAGIEPMRFAYGPASFHRHHRRLPRAAVVARAGLALDLDTIADLVLALTRPSGAWLAELVDGLA